MKEREELNIILKFFGLSNWKDKVIIYLMRKKVVKVGMGRKIWI